VIEDVDCRSGGTKRQIAVGTHQVGATRDVSDAVADGESVGRVAEDAPRGVEPLHFGCRDEVTTQVGSSWSLRSLASCSWAVTAEASPATAPNGDFTGHRSRHCDAHAVSDAHD